MTAGERRREQIVEPSLDHPCVKPWSWIPQAVWTTREPLGVMNFAVRVQASGVTRNHQFIPMPTADGRQCTRNVSITHRFISIYASGYKHVYTDVNVGVRIYKVTMYEYVPWWPSQGDDRRIEWTKDTKKAESNKRTRSTQGVSRIKGSCPSEARTHDLPIAE